MTCIKIFDPASGSGARAPARIWPPSPASPTRCPNIDGVCVACKDVPRSDMSGEVNEFAIMIANTTKPLEYLCEHPASFEAAIDMAAAVRGSRQSLEEKPYFLQIVTPLPLSYWKTHSDQIIAGARAGVPVSVGTLPIGGASTPITLAGCMANSLATDFAAMVLASSRAAVPSSSAARMSASWSPRRAASGIFPRHRSRTWRRIR